METVVEDVAPGVLVAHLCGELDVTVVPEFERELGEWLAGSPPRLLVLDLSKLEFLALAGVAALVRLHGRENTDPRIRIRLAGVSGTVARALECGGALSLFEVYDTVGTARADDGEGRRSR